MNLADTLSKAPYIAF